MLLIRTTINEEYQLVIQIYSMVMKLRFINSANFCIFHYDTIFPICTFMSSISAWLMKSLYVIKIANKNVLINKEATPCKIIHE
jgi:hypothetical protein